MKKRQRETKRRQNSGELVLLGLTALFLCALFFLRSRPAPGIAVRTEGAGAAEREGAESAAPAAVPNAAPDGDGRSAAEDGNDAPDAPAERENASAAAAVDINTADADALSVLPGIGRVLAERIVAYRQENGLFSAPEDLMDVPGIGEAKFAAVRERITAGGISPKAPAAPAAKGEAGTAVIGR